MISLKPGGTTYYDPHTNLTHTFITSALSSSNVAEHHIFIARSQTGKRITSVLRKPRTSSAKRHALLKSLALVTTQVPLWTYLEHDWGQPVSPAT